MPSGWVILFKVINVSLLCVLFLFTRLVTKIITFIQTLGDTPTPFRDLSSHHDTCIFWSYITSAQSFWKNSGLKHFMNFSRIYSRCFWLQGESHCGIIIIPLATPCHVYHSYHRDCLSSHSPALNPQHQAVPKCGYKADRVRLSGFIAHPGRHFVSGQNYWPLYMSSVNQKFSWYLLPWVSERMTPDHALKCKCRTRTITTHGHWWSRELLKWCTWSDPCTCTWAS